MEVAFLTGYSQNSGRILMRIKKQICICLHEYVAINLHYTHIHSQSQYIESAGMRNKTFSLYDLLYTNTLAYAHLFCCSCSCKITCISKVYCSSALQRCCWLEEDERWRNLGYFIIVVYFTYFDSLIMY